MGEAVRSGWGRAAVLLLGLALGGCKVLTLAQDRAIRAQGAQTVDAGRYADTMWQQRLLPALRARTVPATRLIPAIGADVARAGGSMGRQAGEGSAWTFVTSGTGTVVAADRGSRRGTVDVAIDGLPPSQTLRLQVGPVVGGTTVRDAAPFIAFNDFPDQLAFADVGRALNARALAATRNAAAVLEPGARIRFVGTFAVAAPDEPVVITPVVLTAERSRAG